MKYNLKYCIIILCVICFKISQHEIIPSYLLYSIFHNNFVASFHLKVHPFFRPKISIIHDTWAEYSSTSLNISSYVSNNILSTLVGYSWKDSFGLTCSHSHAHRSQDSISSRVWTMGGIMNLEANTKWLKT
jgi:hypothetical protein